MAFESIGTLDLEMVVRLLVAVGLGALIGVEREMVHKPAGLRTHMLVSLGACIFTVTSLTFMGDPARVASGIVTGVGFLGAGSIIALRGHIKGVTTAATLWVAAGIGLSTGLGEYSIAAVGALLVFVILKIRSVEEKLIREKGKKSDYM